MLTRNVLPVLAALAPLALGGCSSSGGSTSLPIPCPQYGILADGADLTVYRQGAAPDLSSLVSDARITGVNGECRRMRSQQAIAVTASVSMAVERGPAATAREVRLPWMIAVTDARTEQVLDRQVYTQVIPFSANVTRSSGQTAAVELVLPVTEQRRVADYKIWVSFHLSPEQLEFNRRRGPR